MIVVRNSLCCKEVKTKVQWCRHGCMRSTDTGNTGMMPQTVLFPVNLFCRPIILELTLTRKERLLARKIIFYAQCMIDLQSTVLWSSLPVHPVA